MSLARSMDAHFAEVSSEYRDLRTTDEAPIIHIREALPNSVGLDPVDIGCGAGRYDNLLFHYLDGLRLTCVDSSADMLKALSKYLKENGHRNFEILVSRIEDLDLKPEKFDFAVTFNAVHHFDFPTFLRKTAFALRQNGRMFVYTRTPEQNAGSIWGRYFPQFNKRETRLYTEEQMVKWVDQADGLKLLNFRKFEYERSASLDRLLAQARGMHYSTFALYPADEFRSASAAFAQAVKAGFPDIGQVTWHDENTMLEIAKI